MAAREDFARRIEFALNDLGHRLGRQPTKTEIGQMVGSMLRGRRFTPSTVQGWFDGVRPELETGIALAELLGVDVGWLYFGSHSRAPAPERWPSFGAQRRS